MKTFTSIVRVELTSTDVFSSVGAGTEAVELHRGLVQSCDTFFYNVGNRMGIDDIAHYAEMVGYGHKTGIDLPHEAEGVVPSSRWKIRNFREKWYPGETISVAIGQGATTVTPLQMAAAIGGISVGGVWHQPHLVREGARLIPARHGELNQENIRKVISGMYGVVNEGGTGVRARLPGINVCGKTGTAQLASNEVLKGTKIGQTMKDNAWFVGFRADGKSGNCGGDAVRGRPARPACRAHRSRRNESLFR